MLVFLFLGQQNDFDLSFSFRLVFPDAGELVFRNLSKQNVMKKGKLKPNAGMGDLHILVEHQNTDYP